MEELPGEVNTPRLLRGRTRLVLNDALRRSATAHALHMIEHGHYGHMAPNGRLLKTRFVQAVRGRVLGENIAHALVKWSSSEIVNMWSGSPVHSYNVLHEPWTEQGTGPAAGHTSGSRGQEPDHQSGGVPQQPCAPSCARCLLASPLITGKKFRETVVIPAA